MVSFTALVLAVACIIGAFAIPTNAAEGDTEGSAPFPGIEIPEMSNYYLWKDSTAQVNFTNGPGGQYTVTWTSGSFIVDTFPGLSTTPVPIGPMEIAGLVSTGGLATLSSSTTSSRPLVRMTHPLLP